MFISWQYLNDVEELENWINDKMALATSEDYGKDESSADKLLTKNQASRADNRKMMLINGKTMLANRSGYGEFECFLNELLTKDPRT